MRRKERWAGLLLLLGAALAACQPGGPPGAPTPTAVAPLLSFAPSVSQGDRTTVARGVSLMRAFLETSAGGAPRGAVTVLASDAPGACPSTGTTSAGRICLDLSSAGWTAVDETRRLKTVAHEYYHAFQYEVGCTPANTPRWLLEGEAEYMASAMLVASGLATQAAETAFDTDQVRASPTLPPLTELTFDAAQGVPAYSVVALAVRGLANQYGLRALRTVCESAATGLPFEDAFRLAFEMTPEAFAESFARFAAGLRGR